jgi:hypothetical protein
MGEQGPVYWTRHEEYALNDTVIIDAETRILYALYHYSQLFIKISGLQNNPWFRAYKKLQSRPAK